MHLLSARWTARVNILLIRCDCGRSLEHPANRRRVVCSGCGKVSMLEKIRDEYANLGKLL